MISTHQATRCYMTLENTARNIRLFFRHKSRETNFCILAPNNSGFSARSSMSSFCSLQLWGDTYIFGKLMHHFVVHYLHYQKHIQMAFCIRPIRQLNIAALCQVTIISSLRSYPTLNHSIHLHKQLKRFRKTQNWGKKGQLQIKCRW